MFTSKRQYKTLTSLISRAFDTKLEKTRHKIAKEAGFKNANAFEATIPEVVSATEKAELMVCVDDLGMKYLLSETEYEHTLSIEGNIPTVYRITCNRVVSLILQGFTVNSEALLTQKMTLGDFEATDYYENFESKKIFILSSSDFESYGMKMYFATFMQRVKPENIITDLEFLERNPDLVRDLLESGSLYQYNFLCENSGLIESLGLQDSLVNRYLDQISLLCDDDISDWHLCCEMTDLLPSYSEVVAWRLESDRQKALSLLKTPPVEFVASLSVLSGNIPNTAFISKLLSKNLVLNTASEEINSWLESCKVYRLDNKNSYVRTELEEAVIRHGAFGVDVVALCISERLRFSDTVDFYLNFIETLSNLDISLDSEFVKEALSTFPEESIFNNGVIGSFRGVEKHSDMYMYNQSLLANGVLWLAYSAVQDEYPHICKELVQKVFSALPSELLAEPVNFKVHLSDPWGFAEQSTVQDILKLALKNSN
ncbi:hypothetical protein [Vibrio sp. D431a]|uniref:hypothetical protein n=1 Tax=Vibrio sp. D431a TaxID=2837388 RepID=UPI0025555F62|nr:hypothetical protein [Vibrio sp. D431a]MDK9789990.1 hypothetical protein [Vibrio sp. D431a]